MRIRKKEDKRTSLQSMVGSSEINGEARITRGFVPLDQ